MSARRDRLAHAAGIAGMPPAALRLVALMVPLAIAMVVAGPLLAEPFAAPSPIYAVVVVGLVMAARLFGLRMRVGGTLISVAWGEAAVIVGFTLIPAIWMPAAVAAGSFLGAMFRGAMTERHDRPFEWVRSCASLTISAGLAAAIVVGSGVDAKHLNPASALWLAGAAVVYLLATLVLLAFYLAARDGSSVRLVVWEALRGSPVIIVGNLALGLFAALLWQTTQEQKFLLVLPPLLWLMHQLYSHLARVRAGQPLAAPARRGRGRAGRGALGAVAVRRAERRAGRLQLPHAICARRRLVRSGDHRRGGRTGPENRQE